MPRPGRRAAIVCAALVSAIVVCAALLALDRTAWLQLRSFASYEPSSPSRVYARPIEIEQGTTVSRARLVRALESLDYARLDEDPLPTSAFRSTRRGLTIHRRSSPLPDGSTLPAAEVEIEWRGSTVARLRVDGAPARRAILDVPLLATLYGREMRECRPVALDELPRHVVQAFLAAEDARFFDHPGVSLPGVLRAAWINVRSGELRQGGSTITQQLVKNLFLSRERTISRKLRETWLAVFLERSYPKTRILEAYLNEIYLGASDGANLIGVGAGARAYFGKEPAELSLVEAATLAGMVAAPGAFDPLRRPAESARRRNWVLDQMVSCGWVTADEAASAKASQAPPRPSRLGRHAPYFVDAALAEARARFAVTEPYATGLELFTTLDWLDQRDAEQAVRDGLTALEDQRERARASAAHPLQAALVSLEPHTGALRAWVGGRDYERSPFDRARQARRQLGSVFKPVVYAAALASGAARSYDLVFDTPLVVEYGADPWVPRNDDRQFRGVVTVREALESSLNVPTVRVALATGLAAVRDLAVELGLTASLEAHPSLALGGFEASPLDVASIYAAFAAAGETSPIHGLEVVLDRQRRTLPAAALPDHERVLSREVAFEVTSLLQGVVDRGTGNAARRLGLQDEVAGKTGTSSNRRDAWFAGYAPDRVAVVWVGYDDGVPTRLSGSAGALPIWTQFMLGARPPQGYPAFESPASVRSVWLDPRTGLQATERCPESLREVIPLEVLPPPSCWVHGSAPKRKRPAAGDGDLLLAYQLEEIETITLSDLGPAGTESGLVIRSGDPRFAEKSRRRLLEVSGYRP